MLTKPIEELSLIDIEELVKKTRFSESERIEYKENLPDNGKVSDPWHRGEDKIGEPFQQRHDFLQPVIQICQVAPRCPVLRFRHAANGKRQRGRKSASQNVVR